MKTQLKKNYIFKKLSDYKKELEKQGYNVIYIGLYGSQNYNVDDEYSDIDCKAIIMPTLHDIIFRKVTSKTIETENGAIDVKDLITFYSVIKKGNFSYVEAIDTKYSIGDKYIKEIFQKIRPNKKSILGAMYEKRRALTHEYPSKTKEFERWGFDPKQYHHIIRLYHLLKTDKDYSYIVYDDEMGKIMVDIKRNNNNLSKKFVEQDSDNIIEKAKVLIPDDYVYVPTNLDLEISCYIEQKLKLELNKTQTSFARQYRTFGTPIPKNDLKKFPKLQKYNGKDISYIVYESLEIL